MDWILTGSIVEITMFDHCGNWISIGSWIQCTTDLTLRDSRMDGSQVGLVDGNWMEMGMDSGELDWRVCQDKNW